jgi:hypothetical protein
MDIHVFRYGDIVRIFGDEGAGALAMEVVMGVTILDPSGTGREQSLLHIIFVRLCMLCYAAPLTKPERIS